jgi:hypothetical protein
VVDSDVKIKKSTQVKVKKTFLHLCAAPSACAGSQEAQLLKFITLALDKSVTPENCI